MKKIKLRSSQPSSKTLYFHYIGLRNSKKQWECVRQCKPENKGKTTWKLCDSDNLDWTFNGW